MVHLDRGCHRNFLHVHDVGPPDVSLLIHQHGNTGAADELSTMFLQLRMPHSLACSFRSWIGAPRTAGAGAPRPAIRGSAQAGVSGALPDLGCAIYSFEMDGCCKFRCVPPRVCASCSQSNSACNFFTGGSSILAGSCVAGIIARRRHGTFLECLSGASGKLRSVSLAS